MAILFRCPCGRTMVAKPELAGKAIRCPNCGRTIRVPSGKERGVALAPSPPATRTTRDCPACGRQIPIDAETCSHCGATLAADGGAVPIAEPDTDVDIPVAAPVAEPDGPAPAAGPAGGGGPAIVYGGARSSWWSRLSSGTKAGILVGIVVVLAGAAIASALGYSSWYAGRVVAAREAVTAARATGPDLEVRGAWTEAAALYRRTLALADYLREAGTDEDRALVGWIERRLDALAYVGVSTGTSEPLYWQAKSKEEFERAMAKLRSDYPSYRQRMLGAEEAARAAVQKGLAGTDRAAYEAAFREAMDAFAAIVASTYREQRSQMSFVLLADVMKGLGEAAEAWDGGRDRILGRAGRQLGTIRETLQSETYSERLWT